jgi:hypothetical protein
MNSDLQNKMYHFEADPPPEIWNKIADALDDKIEQTFPQRLYHYEEQPPVQTWATIESSLQESEEPAVKVVPITRYKKPVRYVAAAASIIAAIFLVTTISNKKTGAGSVLGGTEPTVTTNQSSIVPLDRPATETGSTTIVRTSTPTEKEENRTTPTTTKRSTSPVLPQALLRTFSLGQKFIPRKADKEALFEFSVLDSYMVYSDDEGNAMKLPKKLFSLVHCYEGDASCKERIHRLQQKLATGTTTADFAGILEIIRQLQ